MYVINFQLLLDGSSGEHEDGWECSFPPCEFIFSDMLKQNKKKRMLKHLQSIPKTRFLLSNAAIRQYNYFEKVWVTLAKKTFRLCKELNALGADYWVSTAPTLRTRRRGSGKCEERRRDGKMKTQSSGGRVAEEKKVHLREEKWR